MHNEALRQRTLVERHSEALVAVLLVVDSLHFVFARLLLPYLPPVSSSFYYMTIAMLQIALFAALLDRMHPNDVAQTFCKGASELTTTALLIGFARSIQVVLDQGLVVDTIINAVAQPLANLGPTLASVGMLVFQSLCNLFIPSGSGQAYVTMPIMGPISDIVGVSRQVAVLAYQMGDGFMNMIVPTNAVLMGILGICGIPYGRWFRFVWPLMLQLLLLCSATMAIAAFIGYQ